jgi:hypothetical protein
MPNLFSALISIAALEMGAVLMLLGELGFINIFIGGGSLIHLPTQTILYSDVPEWGALLSNLRYQIRSYPWTGFFPMMAFFIAILSFNLFGEGLRRLVEEGNPLINQVINRYTVILAVFAVIGYNWFSANSAAILYYRQQAEAFDGDRAYHHVEILTHPRMYGRALGSPGPDLAALYIAMEFKEYGLQPGGKERDFFQVRERDFERLEEIPILTTAVDGPIPIYGHDYAAYPGRNMTTGEALAPLRYVSLGELAAIQTPGWSEWYPDLDRKDFSEEILLTLSDREAYFLTAKRKRGLLVVAENTNQFQRRYTLSGRSGQRVDNSGEIRGQDVPYVWISEEMANRLLANSGYTVSQLREDAQIHALEQVFDIPLDTTVNLNVEGTLVKDWPVRNVIGLWPGSVGYDYCADCLGKKLIVVMVKYDSPPIGPEGSFNAANDNASGVAVMLEALRVMKETDYQPYKSILFVAYSGEGLDGGEPFLDPDVSKFLQAHPSFSNFELEAIVKLQGLGAGTGERLEISAGGSLRLADLFKLASKQMGVDTTRSEEAIDISVIYDQGDSFLESGQEAPIVRMFWEGWEESSRLPTDTLQLISSDKLEKSGQALALALMILGRETEY